MLFQEIVTCNSAGKRHVAFITSLAEQLSDIFLLIRGEPAFAVAIEVIGAIAAQIGGELVAQGHKHAVGYRVACHKSCSKDDGLILAEKFTAILF